MPISLRTAVAGAGVVLGVAACLWLALARSPAEPARVTHSSAPPPAETPVEPAAEQEPAPVAAAPAVEPEAEPAEVPRRWTLHGVVLCNDGRLADATYGYFVAGDPWEPIRKQGTTDHLGEFTVEGEGEAPPSSWWAHPGRSAGNCFEQGRAEPQPDGSWVVRIELPQGGTILGQVWDAEGRPAYDVSITLEGRGMAEWDVGPPQGEGKLDGLWVDPKKAGTAFAWAMLAAHMDAVHRQYVQSWVGSFRFDSVRPRQESYRVWAIGGGARGFADVHVIGGQAVKADITIRPGDSSWYSAPGRIVDPHGRPIAGAAVKVCSRLRGQTAWFVLPTSGTHTEPDGTFSARFRLRVGFDEECAFLAWSDQHAAALLPFAQAPMERAEDGTRRFVLTLVQGETLVGTLTDDRGPMPDIRLSAILADSLTPRAWIRLGEHWIVESDSLELPTFHARTDQDGGFRFENLPRARIGLSAEALFDALPRGSRWSIDSWPVPLVPPASVEIRLKREATRRGR